MGELRGGATVAGYIIWHGGNLQKSEFATAVHQHVISEVTGLQTALDGKSASSHTHDDRYFTETEIGATSGTTGASRVGMSAIAGLVGTNVQTVLGNMKSLIDSHDHDGRYYTETELTNNTSGVTVHWGNLTNVPTSFTPVVHNHDDRYFTETELQSTATASGADKIGVADITGLPTGSTVQTVLGELKSKLDSHYHDDRYYTETELTNSTSGVNVHWGNITNVPAYAASVHNHDDRYFTETEIKATTGAALVGVAAISGLTGANVQTVLGSLKSLVDTHNHDASYYTKTQLTNNTTGVTVHWNNLTNVPSAFTPAAHNHDDRYYTETELSVSTTGVNVHWGNITNVPAYAASSHTHDDRYFTETEIKATTGAALVGVAAITGLTGSTVQAVLGSMKSLHDSHNHDASYYTKTQLTNNTTGVTVHWNNLTNIPTAFTPATHNHDDRYFTETEISATTGASLVGVAAISGIAGSNVQTVLTNLKAQLDEEESTDTFGNTYDSNKKLNKVVEHKRSNGTLRIKSTLSNPDAAGNYQTLTVQNYAANGTTISSTQTWTLTYNLDGIITSKVLS